jgi:hypothetical protein
MISSTTIWVMLVYAVVGVERPGIRVIGEYATEPQCLAALVDVPPAVKNWGCFSYLPHAPKGRSDFGRML